MNVFTALHYPSVVTVDRGYPMFPEERGSQYRVIPIDVRYIEVGRGMYWSKFYWYPCTVVDFRAGSCDSELERHLLLKLDGRDLRNRGEFRRYHVRIGSPIQ